LLTPQLGLPGRAGRPRKPWAGWAYGCGHRRSCARYSGSTTQPREGTGERDADACGAGVPQKRGLSPAPSAPLPGRPSAPWARAAPGSPKRCHWSVRPAFWRYGNGTARLWLIRDEASVAGSRHPVFRWPWRSSGVEEGAQGGVYGLTPRLGRRVSPL